LVLTASVLLAQVGKPPDVAEAHRVADDAEEELHLAAPCGAFRLVARDVHRLHGVALRGGEDDGHTVGAVAPRPGVQWRHLVAVARRIDDFGGSHQRADCPGVVSVVTVCGKVEQSIRKWQDSREGFSFLLFDRYSSSIRVCGLVCPFVWRLVLETTSTGC